MAYIEKRKLKDGSFSYRVRIRQKGSPDATQSFPTRTEAVKWAQRMEADVRAGRYFGREDSKEYTLGELIDRYEKEVLPHKKDQRKQKLQLKWWKDELGKFFLCHITTAMILEKREKLRSGTTKKNAPRTNSTINRYMAALSSAYSTCIVWGWMKENPFARIKKLKENKSRDKFLEKEEIQRLLEACRKSKSPHLYPVTLFALSTGARKAEILNLKWKDISFELSTATFGDTKNGDTRTIYLNEMVLNCLKTELKKRKVLTEYVFPSKDGKQPACIRGAWESAVEDACLENVVFHTLRHTVGSHLGMQNNSALFIKEILGHKSLSMVQTYTHLNTSSTALALEKLNEEILGDIACG